MRIALVDDAAISRALFARIAEELGHEVVALGNLTLDAATFGAEALAAIGAAGPDLIVIDSRFGDPLGTQSTAAPRAAGLVARAKSAFPGAAIGLIAALAESAAVRAAGEVGCAYIFARPLLASQVRATLDAVQHARGGLVR